MRTRLPRLIFCTLLVSCFAIESSLPGGEKSPGFAGLTVHEWGTFTSIAGKDGQGVEWSPLTGATDLPSFVEHFRTPNFKLGLRGTVRMETPVLYFYGAQEESVSVHVSFSKGLITEWYPHASGVAPAAADPATWSIFKGSTDGSIAWSSVVVSPQLRTNFLREPQDSRYYAARMTSATPLLVKTPAGEQQEKFLFYRGVASFQVPLSARLTPAGKVQIQNRADEEIPHTILFEHRGDKAGYRIGGAVSLSAALDFPQLTSSAEDLGDLRRELEGMLVAQGLYQDEAHAMVETWRDSWFEEGSRLIYIVPASFVNRILPLAIKPAPAQVARVFVGRMELVTAATEEAVACAFAAHDQRTLEKYGRFLEPILQTMIARESSRPLAAKYGAYLNVVYAAMMQQWQSQR